MTPIRRALLSVSDKTGLVEFARGLAARDEEASFPPRLVLHLERYDVLRYGENPHQRAALYHYEGVPGPLGGRLLQGKPLSYNNVLDLTAAWQAARDFPEPPTAMRAGICASVKSGYNTRSLAFSGRQ